jgi:hypothetical protein
MRLRVDFWFYELMDFSPDYQWRIFLGRLEIAKRRTQEKT